MVQLDCYVYAENDYMARKKAHGMAKKVDTKYFAFIFTLTSIFIP